MGIQDEFLSKPINGKFLSYPVGSCQKAEPLQRSATSVSYTAKKKFSIGYRYITPSDYMTPLMHLPIQRMILEIENPFGKEQIKDAIIKAFDENWYDRRYLEIEDDFFAV